MESLLRRIAAAFRRTDAAQAKPAAPDQMVRVDGVDFLVVRDVSAFMAAVRDRPRIALMLRNLDYERVYPALLKAFDRRYRHNSRQHEAFANADLVCAECQLVFPGSYAGALVGMFGGASRGSQRFGETGTCTRCGSEQSMLVYERIVPADITEDDVVALRGYWRAEAVVWWAKTGKQQGICDVCSQRRMHAVEGYLTSGSRLTCEECLTRQLEGLLDKLREDPYYYGSHELRRARDHASKR